MTFHLKQKQSENESSPYKNRCTHWNVDFNFNLAAKPYDRYFNYKNVRYVIYQPFTQSLPQIDFKYCWCDSKSNEIHSSRLGRPGGGVEEKEHWNALCVCSLWLHLWQTQSLFSGRNDISICISIGTDVYIFHFHLNIFCCVRLAASSPCE